jgi:hypothetical protein
MMENGSLAKIPQNTHKLQKCVVCERDPITYLGGGSVNGTKNLSWRETHHPLQRKRKTEKTENLLERSSSSISELNVQSVPLE